MNDPVLPLRLRFKTDRTASWFAVNYLAGKAVWRKIGNWPTLPFRQAKQKLQKVADDIHQQYGTDEFATLGELLKWYRERAVADRGLSGKRKPHIMFHHQATTDATSWHFIADRYQPPCH